ncbi:MAG: hypothetical protein R2762_13395 [Bryobacteraceae bacterium]
MKTSKIEAVGTFDIEIDMGAGGSNQEVVVALEVDRTIATPDDGRVLGLVFGKLSLR